MPTYQMDSVLTCGGWLRDVAVTVSEQGLIAGLAVGAEAAPATHITGTVVPGMPNAHSHA